MSQGQNDSTLSNDERHSSLKGDRSSTNDESSDETASRQACDEAIEGKPEELDSSVGVAAAPEATSCSLLDIRGMVDMHGLQKKYGHLSYYILTDDTVTVHLEDAAARIYKDNIKDEVHNIVQRCKADKDVTVVIKNNTCESVLCSIGDTLFVNDVKQTIGMYIDYRGIIYWVSTAHWLLPPEKWNSVNCLCEETAKMHLAVSETRQVYLTNRYAATGAESVGLIRAPTPYACVSINPDYYTPETKNLLLHYVDIMIGPVPLLTSEVESGLQASVSSLHEVRECEHCTSENCHVPAHDKTVRKYAISKYLMLEKRSSEGYDYFDASVLKDKTLLCRPLEQNILYGKVMSHQNEFITRHCKSELGFLLNNVLVIKPTGRVPPKQGDCGSVWVQSGTEEAVAITVGKGMINDNDIDVAVWFAALLHPTFDAFCLAHPNVFPDPGAIKPIVPRSTTVASRASYHSPSRPTSADLSAPSSNAADSGIQTSRQPPLSN